MPQKTIGPKPYSLKPGIDYHVSDGANIFHLSTKAKRSITVLPPERAVTMRRGSLRIRGKRNRVTSR